MAGEKLSVRMRRGHKGVQCWVQYRRGCQAPEQPAADLGRSHTATTSPGVVCFQHRGACSGGLTGVVTGRALLLCGASVPAAVACANMLDRSGLPQNASIHDGYKF